MIKTILNKLENPKRPLLGPNVTYLEFWGLLLPDNIFKRYFYYLIHVLITIFTVTEYLDIYFTRSDLNAVFNNFKYTMMSNISVIKIFTFLSWQKHWKSIIEYVTRADLLQRGSSDPSIIKIINAYTNYCRKISYSYCSLIYAFVVTIVLTPIFKYFLSETYRMNVQNGTESYIEVINSWVPFDKSTISGYLVAVGIQTCIVIYAAGWITSFDTNAIAIMVFFRAELEMLRIDSRKIFGTGKKILADQEAMEKIKECHRRHVDLVHYARLFDSCLSPIMLLYMFVCSVMICVTAYQITIETSATKMLMATEYLVFGVAQLFIYCWHSNEVMYMSQDLMLGPYESAWWTSNPKRRKDLYILTEQFRQIIVFTAGPFAELTVPTFIAILRGAYSYYTLLSKSQIK